MNNKIITIGVILTLGLISLFVFSFNQAINDTKELNPTQEPIAFITQSPEESEEAFMEIKKYFFTPTPSPAEDQEVILFVDEGNIIQSDSRWVLDEPTDYYSLHFSTKLGYISINSDGTVETNIEHLGDQARAFWCAVMEYSPYVFNNQFTPSRSKEWYSLDCIDVVFHDNYPYPLNEKDTETRIRIR